VEQKDLLVMTDAGLYCPAGGFHIDPWRPVARAVMTHAHGDHARPGSGEYWCAEDGLGVARRRLGAEAKIRPVSYGSALDMGGARVSLHPAGHILGSSQVRVEGEGLTWVVTGDYKRQADATCRGFEVVPCDVLVTEATFALPIYRWGPVEEQVRDIWEWWMGNAAAGRSSVLFCYALGKAQRVLAELGTFTDRVVYTHGAVEPLVAEYRAAGVAMLPTRHVSEGDDGGERRKPAQWAGELIVAPPSAAGSPWMRRFGTGPEFDTAFASGWVRVRGIRRRRGYDRGFVLSDHADWEGLIRTVRETGARRVLTTHGYSEALARYLAGLGLEAGVLRTEFGEEDD
jgi:putative mRNA 3-end processing factor